MHSVHHEFIMMGIVVKQITYLTVPHLRDSGLSFRWPQGIPLSPISQAAFNLVANNWRQSADRPCHMHFFKGRKEIWNCRCICCHCAVIPSLLGTCTSWGYSPDRIECRS